MGRIVNNHNDGTLVGEDVGTGSDKLKLTDDVISDTFEVNVTLLTVMTRISDPAMDPLAPRSTRPLDQDDFQRWFCFTEYLMVRETPSEESLHAEGVTQWG